MHTSLFPGLDINTNQIKSKIIYQLSKTLPRLVLASTCIYLRQTLLVTATVQIYITTSMTHLQITHLTLGHFGQGNFCLEGYFLATLMVVSSGVRSVQLSNHSAISCRNRQLQRQVFDLIRRVHENKNRLKVYRQIAFNIINYKHIIFSLGLKVTLAWRLGF